MTIWLVIKYEGSYDDAFETVVSVWNDEKLVNYEIDRLNKSISQEDSWKGIYFDISSLYELNKEY